MQMAIFIGLAVLCVLLMIASLACKWCLKPFYAILAVTAIVCLIGGIKTRSAGIVPYVREKADTRESIYISAKLLSGEKTLQAVSAAGEAALSEPDNESLLLLQALGLNRCGSFSLSSELAEGKSDERLIEVQDKNNRKEKLEPDRVTELAEAIISEVAATATEQEQWDMVMRLRYYDKVNAEGEPDRTDLKIRKASLDGNYSEAFALTMDLADKGDLEAKILVSEMFVNNYEPYDYQKNDQEMDEQLNRVTKLQLELEALEAVMREESYEATDGTAAKVSERDLKETQYQMAIADLDKVPVLRAINYLKENRPDDGHGTGYHMQMAKLYYLADMETEAKNELDQIFVGGSIGRGEWLGLECMMLRDSFLDSLHEVSPGDFEGKYNLLFSRLNQGIVIQKTGFQTDFRTYLLRYFRDLYTGIRIGELKVAGYPEISADISYAGTEDLMAEMIDVTDTDIAIRDFTLVKKDKNNLAICIILDRSGSMDGQRITDAKSAINQFIGNVDNGVNMALVTFDSTARVNLQLTDSKAALMTAVNDVATSGGTNIESGLNAGLDTLKDFSGRKVVVLLSDGYDSSKSNINSVLEELAIQDIPVYSIGLSGADNAYMQNIAEVTGGSFTSAENSVELFGIYQMIRQYIMNTYQLTYQVNEGIEITDRELKVGLIGKLSFDTKEYYIGLSGRTDEEELKRIPVSNFYKQIGGSYKKGGSDDE